MVRISGLFHLLINWVYWGYNPLTNLLLTSWDIQVRFGCCSKMSPQMQDVSPLTPCLNCTCRKVHRVNQPFIWEMVGWARITLSTCAGKSFGDDILGFTCLTQEQSPEF